jgi:2-polyprenyl-6-methoxyphenol hydroxylase-like FAD-dependent oxidoreductase
MMRPDLEGALYGTIRDTVPIRFGASIQQIEQASDHVGVSFTDGSQEAFDLLVGAGGAHSNVRKQIFGDEAQFACISATTSRPSRCQISITSRMARSSA